jgi:hypothetical protein
MRLVSEALQLLTAVGDQLTLDVERLVLVHGRSFRRDGESRVGRGAADVEGARIECGGG